MGKYYEFRDPKGVWTNKTFTAEGLRYLKEHRTPPPDDSHIPNHSVRADSTSGDGLVRSTRTDPYSGAKMYEYSLAPGATHKQWLDAHKSPGFCQVGIWNKNNVTPEERAAMVANWEFKQDYLRSQK